MLQNLQTRMAAGWRISFLNELEFDSIFYEIFRWHNWRFSTKNHTPLILDCGAHIGLSVLYFKKLYPKAKIIAFEPNPEIFKLLELNIKQNNLRDVELVNAAVANTTGAIDFFVSKESSDSALWSWGNAGVKNDWYNPETYQTIRVPAVKLSSYINGKVDFVKIDIEGMEEQVLKEIESKITCIEYLAVEFHGNSNTDAFNNLERIASLMKRHGFSYGIVQDQKIRRIDQIDMTKPYLLTLYAAKNSGNIWWRLHIFHNINRINRKIRGTIHGYLKTILR